MHYYSLSGYGSMLRDSVRMTAYRTALEQAIRPGCVVADIGTGTGAIAMLACQLGAGRVYAVEPNDAIQLARQVAANGGFADRITFFHDLSTRITPPARCDVLVSDLRGPSPLYENHIPAIIDARERWLKPGGVQIPTRDSLHAALVESEREYLKYDGAWRTVLPGISLEVARRRTINANGKCNLKAEEVLSSPVEWAILDYRTIRESNVAGELRLTAARDGIAHGIVLWFDTTLVMGTGFTNAPAGPELVYGQLFFPFEEPLHLRLNDTVHVELRADLVGDAYVWSWVTRWSPDEPVLGRPVTFRQSTFLSQGLSAASLRRRAEGYVPRLNEEGRVENAALNGMTGGVALGEIAAQLLKHFPQRFANSNQALAYLGELSVRFSEE